MFASDFEHISTCPAMITCQPWGGDVLFFGAAAFLAPYPVGLAAVKAARSLGMSVIR
jgi:hypothetical protein